MPKDTALQPPKEATIHQMAPSQSKKILKGTGTDQLSLSHRLPLMRNKRKPQCLHQVTPIIKSHLLSNPPNDLKETNQGHLQHSFVKLYFDVPT